ncbi:hypothetical protein [Haloprofundus sp. MHR1]|uniref:hypothetical protein n=1 Tax=Haloprofundus sp. MHR1 TaxID=2572921 RepID=UPI0010BE2AD8|nr:hypothetical protein [Haloprofundus sp. MHR1]QCJ47749.1 hypothetical protein FCF25_11740 [Haloprofundus sp. MHR1]
MKRREALSTISVGVSTLLTGCLGDSIFGPERNCPDLTLENERPYEQRDVDALDDEGVVLVTSRDGIDRLADEQFTDEDDQWVNETDFETELLVGFRHTGSGNVQDFEPGILGVEVGSDRTVRVYSCIEELEPGDVAFVYTALLRVRYEDHPPTRATLSHWTEGEKVTYATGE